MRPGQSFEDAEVVNFYVHRPEYPREIFEKLVELSPGHTSVLDLGCGTGKIARGLASSFASVTGIDASEAMLRVAAGQQQDTDNITWIHGLAESAQFVGVPFDLVVAAASIHWMDHSVVFPRLSAVVSADHVFAVVDGDGAFEPPWQEAWDDFLRYWIYELKGEPYEPSVADNAYTANMTRYRRWIETRGETEVEANPVCQTVEEFIACQHSRDTFAPSKLGAQMKDFDADLAAILKPHADNGVLRYAVRTRLEWGSIRT
jgi:trans-aconitate methyltransferase